MQVHEILEELQNHHPKVTFKSLLVRTTGDKDLQTSLRTRDKTDFFTKEIDELLLAGGCRIAVHSAKDLPEPIPHGLQIVAITKGIDPSDSLVLRQGATLKALPAGAKIATSSVRREGMVRALRSDVQFIDVRGTISQRLAKVEKGKVDGVVIAEAALIRLGLTQLNRIRIPGQTVPFQGQLAILSQQDDLEMQELFSSIDARKTTLYVGLEAPREGTTTKILHYPVITIVPRDPLSEEIQQAFKKLPTCTHILFTSKSTGKIFFDFLEKSSLPPSVLKKITLVAIGSKTSQVIQEKGFKVEILPELATTEGLIDELQKRKIQNAHMFWPHSALSRPLLREFFSQHRIPFTEVILYDTHPHQPGPLPNLTSVSEILFTSPSTVDAFLDLFGTLPKNKILRSIGPITEEHLAKSLTRIFTVELDHNRNLLIHN